MIWLLLWLLCGLIFSGLFLALHFYGNLRPLRAQGVTRWELVKGVLRVMRPCREYLPAYALGILLGPLGWVYLWVGRRWWQ